MVYVCYTPVSRYRQAIEDFLLTAVFRKIEPLIFSLAKVQERPSFLLTL
jgi:hypothetical protein